MPDREKVIKGITHHKLGMCDMSGKICPYWNEDDGCSKKMLEDVLSLLKEQEETIQITKNVAERYANILVDKGVNGVCVRYAVKKGKQFMLEYQNKKASWCYGLDGAWMTFDREMAEGFAKLTKGQLIEVTLTERPLLLE